MNITNITKTTKGHIIKVVPIESQVETALGSLTTIIDSVEIHLLVIPFSGAKLIYKILNPKGKTLKYEELELPEEIYENWGEDDSHIENFILSKLELIKVE